MHYTASTLAFLGALIAWSAGPGAAVARAAPDTDAAQGDEDPSSSPVTVEQEQSARRLGIGVNAGLSLSHFIGKDGTGESAEYSDKPAMTVGLSGIVGITEWLSVQPDLLFVSKGRKTSLDGMLLLTFDLHYIEIPLLARIEARPTERLSAYLLAGPALGFLLKLQRTDADGTVMDLTDEANRIDVSGVLGAGVAFALAPRHELTLEARYDRSFTRILENGDDVKNRTFAFLLGYQYSFARPGAPAP